jgi:hypothetical protein
MKQISVINDVLSVFVLCFQIVEAFLSYSKTVYGRKEIKNKLLIWLVVHFGFVGMFLTTRGLIIGLYFLFIYLCSSCIYTFWISTLLLIFYLCKITCGKRC